MRAAPPSSKARVAICQSEENMGTERREAGKEESHEITPRHTVTWVSVKEKKEEDSPVSRDSSAERE